MNTIDIKQNNYLFNNSNKMVLFVLKRKLVQLHCAIKKKVNENQNSEIFEEHSYL